MAQSFIPYQFNYPYMWMLDALFPVILKGLFNIDNVLVSESDKEILKKYKKERLLYISNHPFTRDPAIAYAVSNIIGERFNYIAARDVFNWGFGLVGKAIQNLGSYSVIAGTLDRQSIDSTKKILSSPSGKVVIFPEGEPTSNENDILFPFQSGISQLGLWGYEEAKLINKNAEIYLIIAFNRYRINNTLKDSIFDINQSLSNLERKLNIRSSNSIKERLLAITTSVITSLEQKANISTPENKDLNFRYDNYKHKVMDYVAEICKIKKWNINEHSIIKLRKLLSTFEMVFVGLNENKTDLPDLKTARWARDYIQKVYDFISLNTESLDNNLTTEKVYDWIYRFELELFGSVRYRPTNVYVRFAPTIKLSDFYSDYKNDKKNTLVNLTDYISSEILKLRIETEKSLDRIE